MESTVNEVEIDLGTKGLSGKTRIGAKRASELNSKLDDLFGSSERIFTPRSRISAMRNYIALKSQAIVLE